MSEALYGIRDPRDFDSIQSFCLKLGPKGQCNDGRACVGHSQACMLVYLIIHLGQQVYELMRLLLTEFCEVRFII